MGAKQTKYEGEYLPATPQLKKLQKVEMDPRSPGLLRTPVATLHLGQQQETPVNFTENTFGLLRKRFLKGFSYNLNDPRSPHPNRTPLPCEDGKDKTLNLDDTFADLFVESRAPPELPEHATEDVEMSEKNPPDTASTDSLHHFNGEDDSLIDVDLSHDPANNTSLEVISMPYEDEETVACPAVLQRTPIIEYKPTQTEWDPRSPTIGIDRTPVVPIILDHDDSEDFEDAMLETVLATLSLDLSATSSVASFASALEETVDSAKPSAKPDNKHLSRVRAGGGIRKRQKQQQKQRQRIYEDTENVTPVKTPRQLTLSESPSAKRTPLSCVKNRAHLRSRSVEPREKSAHNRIAVKSFDDQLNPTQSAKIANIHIFAQDPLDY